MNDLIPINYDGDRPTVMGRELHEALEVKSAYKDWFPRMCEYGFVEGEDFSSFLSKSTGGRPSTDHQLTIPMAKEICMLQRTEKGKEIRRYFIAVEEQWNSPDAIMARAYQISQTKLRQLATNLREEQAKRKALEIKAEQDKPKVIFADAVTASRTSMLVGDLAKMIRQNGVKIGANRLFEWLRNNGYLISRRGTDWNMPTQKSMEMGLFEVKETAVTHSDGHSTVSRTPKVTGKGQQYFVNKFLKN